MILLQGSINFNTSLNQTTFVGIDAHRGEHTALAINRFEEEQGRLAFPNTHEGIEKFISWLQIIGRNGNNLVIGVEGGGTERHALLKSVVLNYQDVYEVNPLYTRQRRDYGTKGDKSDAVDAKLIAEVLTKKLPELPRIIKPQLETKRLVLKKTVWFYEEITDRGAAIIHQINQLKREKALVKERVEWNVISVMLKLKTDELARIRKIQAKLTKELDKLLPDRGRNLTTMVGISTVSAAKLLAHMDGIERFKNLDKFIKYSGIAPVERSSGKTKKYIKANRGNRRLNAAIYMIALTQLIHDPKAKEYFNKKLTEGKTKKHALRCLMKRVACIVYGMMKSGEAYRS